MKSLITFVVAITISAFSFGQAVELKFDIEELRKEDTLRFSIISKPDILLEIVVFTEGKLLLHQNSRLNDEVPFEIPMKEHPVGKYHLLILGDDLNIQKDFILKD